MFGDTVPVRLGRHVYLAGPLAVVLPGLQVALWTLGSCTLPRLRLLRSGRLVLYIASSALRVLDAWLCT